jgi:hypothetical protein
MKSSLSLVLCLAAASAPWAIAQTDTTSASSSHTAYVYVSKKIAGGSANEVEAFSVASNGKLTPIDGSPFQENVTNLAVNKKSLFATNNNGFDIDTYHLESNGAPHYESTTSIVKKSNDCGWLGPLFTDRTGNSLYDVETDGNQCANNTYEFFSENQADTKVEDTGNKFGNGWLSLPAAFVGNNVYAYSVSCLQDSYWGIFGFKRSSSGSLNEININANPPNPPAGYFYCPSQLASDDKNHVAIAMQPVNQDDFTATKPAHLATYTATADGNLSTKSTNSNMPETSVGNVNVLSISPSGKLLAVGGNSGLEIFHYNAAEPITKDTGLLTKDEIDQFFWDNANHLFAIGHTSGKLFVFTVTPTSAKEAPGSPYSIEHPLDIAVLPLS